MLGHYRGPVARDARGGKASLFAAAAQRRKWGHWSCRIEPLEARVLLAVVAGGEKALLESYGYQLPCPDFVEQASDDPAAMTKEAVVGFDGDTSEWFAEDGSSVLGDVTPTGDSYMLYENWGGTWSDVEKSPNSSEDDLLCWAGAASNVLEWTGWGLVGGMTDTDDMFQYFQDHWTDEGGWMNWAWDWWFDGSSPGQGGGGTQVDVPGGGFYPSENFQDYFHYEYSDSQALGAIDQYLHNGYGTSIGIFGPGGHAITVWGYNYNPSNPTDYYGLWVTDSDDSKSSTNPPDRLRYYEVENVSGAWYLQDYYGSDSWYIGAVEALAPSQGTPTPPPDPSEIHGTVFDDANGNGVQDAGEPGLEDRTVFLDVNGNGTFENETQSFSTDAPVSIVDNTTVTSTIVVSGGAASIADLNVTLDVTHTWDQDLDVCLVGPDGTQVELFSGVGSSGDNFTGTTLDDEASTAVTAGSAPFSGSFRPEGQLSDFDGKSANGTWTLRVTDTATWDSGTLNSWSLEFSNQEPYTLTNANGDYSFTELDSGDYNVRADLAEGWSFTAPAGGLHAVSLQEGQTLANVDFAITDSQQAPATDLGTVESLQIANLDTTGGDYWYIGQTARQGYLTIEALFSGSTDDLELKLYDASQSELAVSSAAAGGERIDWVASGGETFYISVTGNISDVDLRLANMVRLNGDKVIVTGTAGDDRLDFAAASWHQVTINNVHYQFDSATVDRVQFNGISGDDTAVLVGSTGDDTASISPTFASLTGSNYMAIVADTDDIIILGGGGNDTANMYDSAGDDTFNGRATYGELFGSEFYNRAENFDSIHAYALAGGYDVASFYDSAGDDNFIGQTGYGELFGTGFLRRADLFEGVHAYSTAGGHDVAHLYDSAGDDTFIATAECAKLHGTGFSNRVKFFAEVYAHADQGGDDTARLYDSAGDDTLVAGPQSSTLQGNGFYNQAANFDRVVAFATGGHDVASFYDSPGDDVFTASPTIASLSGDQLDVSARSFDAVHAYASAGGLDVAHLFDSAGDDTFVGRPTWSKMSGDGFLARAKFFDNVHGYATRGGNDTARLFDSAGDDTFIGRSTYSKLVGDGFMTRAKFFENVTAMAGSGGNDTAFLYDSAGNDRLDAADNWAALSYAAQTVSAEGFSWAKATSSSGGNDTKHVEAMDFVLQTQGPWTDV